MLGRPWANNLIGAVVKVRRNAAELSSGTYHFEQSRVPSPVVGGTQFRQTTTVKKA